MAEDGEQASRRGPGLGPRPVAALRKSLGLQAGFAVRRAPPAATEPDGSGPAARSNDGSLADARASRQPPAVRPRTSPAPSNNGNLREQTPTPEGGTRPAVRPAIRPPGGGTNSPAIRPPVDASMGAGATVPVRLAAGPARMGTAQSSPACDDSQTGNHFPQRASAGEARRRAIGPASGQIDGAEAAESMAGPRFPDEGRSFPDMEDDDFGSDDADASSGAESFDELPTEPALAAASAPVAPHPAKEHLDKPRGPDYAEMRMVIAAAMGNAKKARVRWRHANIEQREGLDAEEKERLLKGEGRVKVPSPGTRMAYIARGRGMLARFIRETGIRISLEDIDPRQFVNWLLGLKPLLTDNTWRSYRVCAAAVIQSIPSEHIDEGLGMLQADLQVGSDEGHPAFTKKGKKNNEDEGEAVGASLRAKRMEYQHYQHLRDSLRAMSRSQGVEWLRDWLDAGIHTGLRPMEWALTSLERRPDRRFRNGERIWLHVVNAKAADGRPTHRTLDISEFTAETLGAVERMVERSRDWVMTGRSNQRQAEVSRLFRQTCRALFPRMQMHYTLYSLRHQFIANMKTIYSREELAAMVGNISIDTQVEHYAKRRASWTREQITEVPKPVKEQVAQMKKQLELLDLRLALKAMKEAARAGSGAVEIDS